MSALASQSGINPNYVLSGKIAREVKSEVEGRDWRNKLYSELADFVEGQIQKKGGSPAFPTNICANESAAHYTPEIDDQKTVSTDSLLKVDIGVHVNGFVADTAVTLCYNDGLLDMTEAAKNALGEALKAVRLDGRISDVGRVVENYASRRGYIPISNLSGHSMEQYEVHAGISVPNVISSSQSAFRTDKVYAIEPFLTQLDANGSVIEGSTENIFGITARKRLKDKKLNDFLDLIWNHNKTLPFAARWFSEFYKKDELESMLLQLKKSHLIHSYPELIEATGRPVAQAEHTISVSATGVNVIT